MECEDSGKEITGEMMRWNTDILAIQELCWPRRIIIDKADYSMIYSGPEQ